jgi:hypothetical protein
MRTPDRDRCRFALAALCIALVAALFVPAAGALNATYEVLPNGTLYTASVDITGVSKYMFADTGIMGENIPIDITSVSLTAENQTPVDFNWTRVWSAPSVITFPNGNYTVNYTAPVKDSHLQESFPSQYHVTANLPANLSVENPLLAGISQGANVTRFADNTTRVTWNKTLSFDLRFYDQNRETLLYIFGNFWIIFAVILLVPFLLLRRDNKP